MDFFIVVKQEKCSFPALPLDLRVFQKQDLSLLAAQPCPTQALGELSSMDESTQSQDPLAGLNKIKMKWIVGKLGLQGFLALVIEKFSL